MNSSRYGGGYNSLTGSRWLGTSAHTHHFVKSGRTDSVEFHTETFGHFIVKIDLAIVAMSFLGSMAMTVVVVASVFVSVGMLMCLVGMSCMFVVVFRPTSPE